MRSKLLTVPAACLNLFLVIAISAPAVAAEVPRISSSEFKAIMGKPDVVIVDVRSAKDWEDSKMKLRTAVRVDPDQIDTWAVNQPKDKTYVFYCASSNEETSVKAAQRVIDKGFSKVYVLKGGWRGRLSAYLPTEPK
jgi:rhodanese-related sulfurtransferase